MLTLRASGLLNREIARILGLATQTVASRFSTLRGRGVEVPESPYHRGAPVKTADQRREMQQPDRKERRSVRAATRCVRCDAPMRELAPGGLCGFCLIEADQR